MKLSESLRRNIIETRTGNIINRFKLLKRRNVFFFEELEAQYIHECEKSGYSEHTLRMGQEWMSLVFKALMPSLAKNIPPTFFLNHMVKKLWNSIGLVESFVISKSGNELTITTHNEAITRYIGANSFTVGCYLGIINAVFDSSAKPVKTSQSRHVSEYTYLLEDTKPLLPEGKPSHVYWNLNQPKEMKGYTIKHALKNNIFRMKNNIIYFREKHISPVESTIFTIIGESGILQDRIVSLSYDFFSDVVAYENSENKILHTLKTLFQIMGWGRMNIITNKNAIRIELAKPPYSLKKTDNWNYLALTILGYLKHINPGLVINSITPLQTGVSFLYTVRS